jgi:hypothetical protein
MSGAGIDISAPGVHTVRITNAAGVIVRTIMGNGPMMYVLARNLPVGTYVVNVQVDGRNMVWTLLAGKNPL